jgi:ribulose-phosphate 3-epimerase
MKLAPSLLAADFGRLLDQALTVADLSDYLHWDVMDGHFVPNLNFWAGGRQRAARAGLYAV